jgi:N-acetylglucosamine kinase-like BadF-type ATPase
VSADGFVVAVDGGGVKTDLALLDSNGALLSFVRGGRSQAYYLGVGGCVEVLESLLDSAVAEAGLAPLERPLERPLAATAQVLLAGLDLPEELAALSAAMERLRWSERLVLGNDTEALLRAGTERGWGIAVVCGTGINCLGLAPGGRGSLGGRGSGPREARFLSFGPVSGDWGGGRDVGLAALAAAVRADDGRGPRTVLEDAVPSHFGLRDAFEVARAFHLDELPEARLGELAPVVLAVGDEDPVAAEIVRRLTDEVVAFAVAALRRLELTAEDPDVVLGGRLLRAVSPAVVGTIARGVREVAPAARVVVAPSEPIVGAALLALDAVGADAGARARARAELDAAVAERSAAVVDRLG